MKITIKNSWAVLIEEFDLNQATDDEINAIGKYILTNMTVAIRGQQLTKQEEIAICERFGQVQQWTLTDRPVQGGIWEKDADNKIHRVTGGLDEHGLPGLFGHVSDLDWHCNATYYAERKTLIWLYGVRGTVGSRTSWINNILTYEALQKDDPEFFNQIKYYKLVCGYERGRYSPNKMNVKDKDINPYFNPSLVYTNPQSGVTGFFLSPLQIFYFIDNGVNMSEEESKPILERLMAYITQERFMYHHDWQDGDLVLSDQWFSIHKRWKFDAMDKRLLHRMECDFSKITFN